MAFSLIFGLVFFQTILGVVCDFLLRLRQNPNSIPQTENPAMLSKFSLAGHTSDLAVDS
jgi:hypothetical protein